MKYKLEFPLSPELEQYRGKIEETIKPYIEITIENNGKVKWWQSKFGGFPYLPKDFDYPTSLEGKYLFLLAQINFAEVTNLEDFPNQGILQFYIADDDLFGEYDENFKVLYFPEPNCNTKNIITDYSFLPEREYFPVDGCCSLQFTKKYAPISQDDYQFKKLLGEDFYESFKFDEEYRDISSAYSHKIGGYHYSTQGLDVRAETHEIINGNEKYTLLFQMDSDANEMVHISWGDLGVCNFFIEESKLKNLDFSDVIYYWDCH